jgi:NAD(P)-dependent dehydrogenase (short-subunit alcohol dehydrogenase family)
LLPATAGNKLDQPSAKGRAKHEPLCAFAPLREPNSLDPGKRRMKLENKVAIVTGAGSGIGRATAIRFAAEGAFVLCADLKGQDDTAAEIGAAAVAIQADAGSDEDVQDLVQAALQYHGGLDIFFANAGISGGLSSIFEQSAEDWQEILRVNLIGPFLAIKHAAPVLKERGGGSIICTASVAGIRAGAGGPAYSASKAGVINLVKVAATQFAGANIRVNAICPGLIETGMTKPVYDWARAAGKEDKLGHLNPMKRGGVPDEIAAAALFLASDESSYVNGHALVVDGGLSISHPFNSQEYGRTAV